MRFVVGFSRRTGLARRFRDRILVEEIEEDRTGWEPAQIEEIAKIMKIESPVLFDGARLQHSRFGRHLKTRGGMILIIGIYD